MAPPSKKAKRERNNEPPTPTASTPPVIQPENMIVITLPGQKPDTEIILFEKAYYVSSNLLKVHSNVFAALLDYEDTKPLNGNGWQYSVIAIREEKEWNLYLKNNIPLRVSGRSATMTVKEKQDAERAFKNLMNAVANKGLDLLDCEDIVALAKAAEKFGLLPSVASGLDGAFFKNPSIFDKVIHDPCRLLVAAYKLRHKTLFNDCLILALGPWSKPRYGALKNLEPRLWDIAEEAFQSMRQRVEKFSLDVFKLLAMSGSRHSSHMAGNSLVQKLPTIRDSEDNVSMPALAHLCHQVCRTFANTTPSITSVAFETISKTNLRLVKSDDTGAYRDYFLCIEVTNFPWDDSEWA